MTRAIETPSDSLVRRTRELVDINSVSTNEEAITAYIRQLLPDCCTVVYDHDSVLAVRLGNSDLPTIFLAGHTDTVPLGAAVFPSALHDDVIHGRGTSDMKGALAMMLQVATWWSQLSEAEQNATGSSLGLLFFGREELPPQHNPLPAAIEACQELRDASLVILMEPTDNLVEVGCLGNLNLTLNYRGKATHSARPWTGQNAAHGALRELEGLEWAKPNPIEISGFEFIEVASVTGMRSGIARNVIPGSAEIDINIRFAWSDISPADREEQWRAKFPDAEMIVVGHANAAPPVADGRVLQNLIEAGATGLAPKQAWTNAADFAEHHIPVVHLGPGDPTFAHTDDEHIRVSSLHKSYEVLTRFLSGRPNHND